MEIIDGELIRTPLCANAMGGSELFATKLASIIDRDLLDGVQIINSRVGELLPNKTKILVLHDLPEDPASDHLKNGGYNLFDLLVFVSNWQMQRYIERFNIPWYKCMVVENAIDPIQPNKPSDKIKLIYHTTPHRGLELLVPVFERLAGKHPNIELDVYSSFKIYGWEKRDEPYLQLFERCKDHPQINYMGTVSNEEVKLAVAKAHIFAYPSIWLETSCISLMEAMSAGCVCVHPNYGALYETAGGMTQMYQWQQDKRDHASTLYAHLDHIIQHYDQLAPMLGAQQAYANARYSWAIRKHQWTQVLESFKRR